MRQTFAWWFAVERLSGLSGGASLDSSGDFLFVVVVVVGDDDGDDDDDD
eukprot:CAMPEP_0203664716 /NCGR_PEP_ID=MMETSP0090-20130426/2078_1 /ASSEMBLY_ACC=CAM_ASM_001088 /TAXON_ID=426623 /ORGANISM="Chaetoceros affinis, Strain CCMP159" /LENGTH=48 /DNA_ID= /DNA_START= /DNA_END= /DNA_ORIENTATION=